jgi:hypothetical protein
MLEYVTMFLIVFLIVCSWEHVGEYFENLELLEPIGKLWKFDARIVRTFWEFGGNTLRTPK